MDSKIIIYQVFTRLFGNRTTALKPHGDKRQNGCGKMADFTANTLDEIKKLGVTHIWYTGIIEHATQTDYSAFGIAPDHPSVVKGKAGSPYAIKDYYDVDPDLAMQVGHRMKEFENLVNRTHKAKLKVIIDFVPNHVARQYHSDACPQGVADLGENDNPEWGFSPKNNFYYLPGETLHLNFSVTPQGWAPYTEQPAKATGNDHFSAWPGQNDWYETVKLNYGVDYKNGGSRHFDPIPDTWIKMRDILLFWAKKNVDGFRCDMAEMVPVEFWEWVIPQIKKKHPKLIFIAEVYNPHEYRNYIHRGKFDFLYDKVGLYDTLRAVICGYAPATAITSCWQQVDDINGHMLNFLENHDEQRLASDFFAGNGIKGKPGLLVSACMRNNPFMLYFGQEFGERGMDEEGFSGRDGRTSIFDYWSIDTIRRWRESGSTNKYMNEDEKELHAFYRKVLNLCLSEPALHKGTFYDLMYVQHSSAKFNTNQQYAFLRQYEKEILLVVANFGPTAYNMEIHIPEHVFEYYKMQPLKETEARELLTGNMGKICFCPDEPVRISVPPHGGCIWKIRMNE